MNIHSASKVDPAEYTYVGSFYEGPSRDMNEAYDNAHKELGLTLKDMGRSEETIPGVGVCASCGTVYRHGAVFLHEPTGELLAVGSDCANSTFGFLTMADRIQAKVSKENAKKTKAEKLAAEVATFLEATEGLEEALNTNHQIVQDVKAKLEKFGSLSDAQVAMVLKIAKEAAERAATEPTPVPVPEGRQVLKGTILTVKLQESFYGDTLKMLVQVPTEEGAFKVWGSVHSSLLDEDLRGRLVQFTATVERSDKDEAFGFYKRPTKATLVEVTQ